MASEPAEPTTRQDEGCGADGCVTFGGCAVCGGEAAFEAQRGLIAKAAKVVHSVRYTRDDEPTVVDDAIAGALAEAGLLADPAQTTELEKLRREVAGLKRVRDDVDELLIAALGPHAEPGGGGWYADVSQLIAERDEARAQRNEAMETAGQLRDDVHEHQVAAANLYGRVFVALGLSITAPWAGLADAAGRVRAERDALSLLLRGMARKLVAYRKWMLGDDVPVVHRLRREAEERQARLRAALVGDQPKAEEPKRAPCPEGYHFVGQPLNHCSECGLPPWYHAGMSTLEDNSDPFGSGGFKLRPWAPGEREALRAKWEPALSGVALRDVEEADDAAGDQT
jgi:hypothetical protein